MTSKSFARGVRRGLPVGVGYFSVSFGFGAMAVSQGIRALDAALISLTNLTSAGQFAGLTLIVAAASLWEIVLTQIVINSRYSLMSLALSQRMGTRVGFLPRLALAFINTDEIFALAMAYEKTCLNTGGLNWAYLNKILTRWQEAGFKTAAQIRSGDRKPAEKPAPRQLDDDDRAAIARILQEV